jgi:CheY-like chemotaxis protein
VLPSRPEFEHWVRTALSHLYDVPALQGHPLAPFMGGAAGPGGQSQRLREELLGAIHALQPAPGTRQQTPAWRAYRILELRYIEGLTPAETMAELAISRSQFYKEQARVVAAVTELLWQKLDAPPPAIVPAPSDEQTLSRKEIALTEAERLRNHSQQTTVDLGQVLRDLRPLVDSLAQIRHVAVRYTIMAGLRIAHADRVMARQAILNVATYALDRAPGGQVELMSFQGLADVGVWVMAMQPSGFPATPAPPAAMLRQGVGLEVGQRLMAAMKGELSVVETQPERWIAHLRWQAPGAATLLVVDDNEGFISLVSRYLAGSNCRVIGATSVAQAKQLLAANEVAAILSDVMMPDEDGWEFLAAVKAAPETAAIPFVVCSVLREPELAAALGAAACLTKPLTLAALHETLARWIEIAPSPETGNPG